MTVMLARDTMQYILEHEEIISMKIFWAGDSTVKDNDFTTYPQTGMGQGLRLYVKKNVVIENHAKNARSTKSFLEESRLEAIKEELAEGDLLIIQFGHNDAKIEDPNRYVEAFGDYQKNLEIFIQTARDKKAHPLLITPLCRRWFENEQHLKQAIHGDYPDAMTEVSRRTKVPCIDLYNSSRRLIEATGIEGSKKFFMIFGSGDYANYPEGIEDDTHLRYEGAVAFAGLVAQGLKELGGLYRDLLLEADSI